MSFNTFCGQDPTNAATYNKVLLRFQEGGGGGGVAAVNAGANISIPNPLVPVVALQAPLTANLDLGAVDVVDSGGIIGAAGTVLSSNGAGAGTAWIAAVPAGNVVVPNDNANLNRYLTWVAATGGPQQISADSGAGAVSVNPFQGDFNVVDTVIITQSQLSIGKLAGSVAQAATAVAIGFQSGQSNQGAGAVAIGEDAGNITQGADAVAIGTNAGLTNQAAAAVAIGNLAGQTQQGVNAVAIGQTSGNLNQGQQAVAIGAGAGDTAQGIQGVAMGFQSGQTNQGGDAVAIGTNAGLTNQGANAVAIGNQAGLTTQSGGAVAIGTGAGNITQGGDGVAIGTNAAANNQGLSAVAIGNAAGTNNQGIGAIAIGDGAGDNNQGADAIAIGENAATLNQVANSICINATGVALQTATASLYVAPIINSGAIANPVPAATNFLLYNPATAEVTYGDGAGIGGGGGATPVDVINCVPWGYEITTNGSLNPIKSSTSAEFMLGNFKTTVGNLYNITGTLPNSVPPFYQDAVFCTCFVNLVIPEGSFVPNLPFSAGGFGNILNQDITAGAIPPYQVDCATQILWRLGYTVNAGAYTDLATPTFASSPVLNFPELSLVFSPPVGNKFHSSVSMTGLLDITGMLTTDIIDFQLQAYCNFATAVIDTTTATGGTIGSINLMCRPVRNP